MAGFATPNESPQHLEARLQLGSACKKGDLQAVLQLLDGGEIALDHKLPQSDATSPSVPCPRASWHGVGRTKGGPRATPTRARCRVGPLSKG